MTLLRVGQLERVGCETLPGVTGSGFAPRFAEPDRPRRPDRSR